jgi:hypothetical protein
MGRRILFRAGRHTLRPGVACDDLSPVRTGPNSKDSSYVSLEGFIVARVAVGALRRRFPHGGHAGATIIAHHDRSPL